MIRKYIAALGGFLLAWFLVYFNLHTIADFIVFDVLGLEPQTHLGESLSFFIFEVPKVLMLLVLIVFVVGVIRSWFSPEKTRRILEGKSVLTGNVLAALLGIVTPFCSCSAIPLFLGFVEAGIPIGVTFSFLIAAPMINEVALVLLVGMFSWQVAIIYAVTGLAIAILAGFIIEKLRLQNYVADWVFQMKSKKQDYQEQNINFAQRLEAGTTAVKDIVGKIWVYVILGIAVGAGAHGYVPDEALAKILGAEQWYSVPLAILVGVPLYANAASIVPIVSVLIEKGVSLGTSLAFMMSVIGLSLPEVIILKKVLKWQLILAFVLVVAFGIVCVGVLFNHISIIS